MRPPRTPLSHPFTCHLTPLRTFVPLPLCLQAAMSQYSPALLDELVRFSWNEPGVLPLEGTESGGPFLDMGNVPSRSVCCITIVMRNLLPHDVNIDVLARGFDSEDTKVNTKTKPIVPGMSQFATVSFTTSDRVGSQVGLVTIHAYSERKAQRTVLTCPVFYRIDPTVRPRSLMDIRSFPDAKQRFLGCKEDLRVSFERRTDGGGGIFADSGDRGHSRPSSAAATGRSRLVDRVSTDGRDRSRLVDRVSISEPVIRGHRVEMPRLPIPGSSQQPKVKPTAVGPKARPSTAHK